MKGTRYLYTIDKESLPSLADKALYSSKKQGRNRFTMFNQQSQVTKLKTIR